MLVNFNGISVEEFLYLVFGAELEDNFTKNTRKISTVEYRLCTQFCIVNYYGMLYHEI